MTTSTSHVEGTAQSTGMPFSSLVTRLLDQAAFATRPFEISRAGSAREAPSARSERIRRSRKTDASPASISATRDWLDLSSFVTAPWVSSLSVRRRRRPSARRNCTQAGGPSQLGNLHVRTSLTLARPEHCRTTAAEHRTCAGERRRRALAQEEDHRLQVRQQRSRNTPLRRASSTEGWRAGDWNLGLLAPGSTSTTESATELGTGADGRFAPAAHCHVIRTRE